MTQQKKELPTQYTPETLPAEWAGSTKKETDDLLNRINASLAKGQGPLVKAYSCRRWGSCDCWTWLRTELRGNRIYWYKNRPYTLAPSGWGVEYSEIILDLTDLDDDQNPHGHGG